jgi:hypothetical protein
MGAAQFELVALTRLDVEAGVQRESARACCTVVISFQLTEKGLLEAADVGR